MSDGYDHSGHAQNRGHQQGRAPHPGHPYGYGDGQQNPYAQPVPPQQSPYAQPVPPVGGAGFPGPAPRRSRTAVLAQFLLQWFYAPLWILALVALFALLLFGGGGGPSGPDSDGWLKVNRSFIPPRRLRAELTGRPEDWEAYLAPILERRIRRAEAEDGWEPADLGADGVRTARVRLALRFYRGLGAAGVVRLAERHGWSGSAAATDEEHVVVTRRIAPGPVHGPAPHDPPAAPGTPWGPQSSRFALVLPFMLLLQLGYAPVYGLTTFWVRRSDPEYWSNWGARWMVGPRAIWPELTGSSTSWDRHVRRILERDVTKELAKLPDGYNRGADGGFLRRVRVDLATYRGVGAHHVLRVAAGTGWQLDPSYPPRPDVSVRLCRPDRTPAPEPARAG